MLDEENSQLRQTYLKRSQTWTEENREREMLILLFVKTILNPSGWNSFR